MHVYLIAVKICLILKENVMLFSKADAPFYIPTSTGESLSSTASWPTLSVVRLSNSSPVSQA